MIRRELKLNDDAAIWLLISQVDHARMSGELVRNWREKFSPEVVDAIAHHDDGWADWESEPKLNPAIGAPYSFLEMPLAESLVIWDRSIASARKLGPLAGWIVAGHFYNLLADSDHANEPPAIAWLTAKRKVRTTWLDEWIRTDRSHTLEYAKAVQQLLPLADLFSLWLCCDCPVDAKEASILANSAMKLRTDSLLAQFRFVSPECTIFESGSRHRVEELSWIVPVAPFPFKTEPLALTIQAKAAPATHYATLEKLVAASWSMELSWRLVPAV
jgi:Protein of unknown function (DUF3891)